MSPFVVVVIFRMWFKEPVEFFRATLAVRDCPTTELDVHIRRGGGFASEALDNSPKVVTAVVELAFSYVVPPLVSYMTVHYLFHFVRHYTYVRIRRVVLTKNISLVGQSGSLRRKVWFEVPYASSRYVHFHSLDDVPTKETYSNVDVGQRWCITKKLFKHVCVACPVSFGKVNVCSDVVPRLYDDASQFDDLSQEKCVWTT